MSNQLCPIPFVYKNIALLLPRRDMHPAFDLSNLDRTIGYTGVANCGDIKECYSILAYPGLWQALEVNQLRPSLPQPSRRNSSKVDCISWAPIGWLPLTNFGIFQSYHVSLTLVYVHIT